MADLDDLLRALFAGQEKAHTLHSRRRLSDAELDQHAAFCDELDRIAEGLAVLEDRKRGA